MIESNNIKVSEELQENYNEQYNKDLSEWRRLGARAKSKNIISLVNKEKFEKVIEIGAGDGSILENINNNDFFDELSAIEISDSGIEKIKKRKLNKVKLVEKFDGYSTNFQDKEFDLAYCSHVIEHVEHPRILLREIKRISKTQIFEIPIDFSFSVDKKVKHFLSYGHINIYTPGLFRFLLLSENFRIIKGDSKMLDIDVEQHIIKSKRLEQTFIRHLIFKFKIKFLRLIWRLLPNRFKDYKPQTYTVMTKSQLE